MEQYDRTGGPVRVYAVEKREGTAAGRGIAVVLAIWVAVIGVFVAFNARPGTTWHWFGALLVLAAGALVVRVAVKAGVRW